MMNDVKLFSIIPIAKLEDARRVTAQIYGEGVIDWTAPWSADGNTTHTHLASGLPIPSETVTRFSLAILWRELFPEPEEGSGITELFDGDTLVARFEPDGTLLAAIFAHKMKIGGSWVTVLPRTEWLKKRGVVPFFDVPPI